LIYAGNDEWIMFGVQSNKQGFKLAELSKVEDGEIYSVTILSLFYLLHDRPMMHDGARTLHVKRYNNLETIDLGKTYQCNTNSKSRSPYQNLTV